MDTGKGRIEPISKEKFEELDKKEVSGVFRIGEVLKIKGSNFVVHALRPKKMILKVLPSSRVPERFNPIKKG